MKTLILTDKEFDFLQGMVNTAVTHREEIREKNPMLGIINAISSSAPKSLLQGEMGDKLNDLRKRIDDDEREFMATTLSLKTKMDVAAAATGN